MLSTGQKLWFLSRIQAIFKEITRFNAVAFFPQRYQLSFALQLKFLNLSSFRGGGMPALIHVLAWEQYHRPKRLDIFAPKFEC